MEVHVVAAQNITNQHPRLVDLREWPLVYLGNEMEANRREAVGEKVLSFHVHWR